MKRIAILLLAVLLLVGCGKRKQNQEPIILKFLKD